MDIFVISMLILLISESRHLSPINILVSSANKNNSILLDIWAMSFI